MKKKTVFGIDLSSYLQLLSTDKVSCLLRVRKDNNVGIICICDGEPHDAQSKCQGEEEQHELKYCEEAVYEMLSWEEPIIEVHPPHQAVIRKIHKSLTFLLMESCRLTDERKEMIEQSSKNYQEPRSFITEAFQKKTSAKKNRQEGGVAENIESLLRKETGNESGEKFNITDYLPLIEEDEKASIQGGRKSAKKGKKIIFVSALFLISGLIVSAFFLSGFLQDKDPVAPDIPESGLVVSEKILPANSPGNLGKTSVPQTITNRSVAETAVELPEQTDSTKKVEKEKPSQETAIIEQPTRKQPTLPSALHNEEPETYTIKKTVTTQVETKLQKTDLIEAPRKSKTINTRKLPQTTAPRLTRTTPLPKRVADGPSASETKGPDKQKASEPSKTIKNPSSNISADIPVRPQKQKTVKTVADDQFSPQNNVERKEIGQAIQDVSRAVDKYKKYPRAAQRGGYGGVVKIQIMVNVKGQVVRSTLYETSGRKVLDTAAMKAARNLLDKKVTSASLSEDLSIIVPVRFSPR